MENRPRLLIVDDEPLIRTALVDVLENAGYSTMESSSGNDAIAKLRINRFAAIVTDIRIGAGLNGWDVARFARMQYARIAVVYMSGDSAADWAAEGVPMSRLMQKPFAMAQIIATLSNLLLGSGLVDHSQNMTVAARAMAEKKTVVAGGDPTPALEATEHDLDAAAVPVPALVISDRLVA